MSKYVRPRKPAAGGFTLIELLVVIVILGILAALLTPALMAAREQARQSLCLNHQKELSGAILIYEGSAGHFPGFVNLIPGYNYAVSGGSPVLTWCEVVLPQIGREDLWKGDGLWPPPIGTGSTGFRSCYFPSVKLSPFICPDDGNASALGITAPLTYIVNSNICNNRLLSLTGSVVDVMVSKLQKSTRTLLLGEGPMPKPTWNLGGLKLLPPPTTSVPDTTRQWNWGTQAPFSVLLYTDYTWNPPQYFPPLNLTFTWSPGATHQPNLSLTYLFANPPNHPGVYVVTFCDGHAEKLAADVDCLTISTRVDAPFPEVPQRGQSPGSIPMGRRPGRAFAKRPGIA